MRAIDADALIDGYRHMGYDPSEHPEESYMEGWCKGFNSAVDHCVHHVIHAHTIEPEPLKQVKILATVLNGCPLTEACDKLFDHDRDWCQQHCKPGQDVADAECWMKYAEVMTDD